MMQIRKELAYFCNKVYDKGFVAAYDGNLSVRIEKDKFLITRSAKSKGEVIPSDFLVINSKGKILEGQGKVSTESKIHLLAYENRPEINAVIHAHPTYATILASSEIDVNQPILPEVVLILGKIAKCKYGTPSTNELPETMMPFIKNSFAFLLANHGAVTISTSIKDAYYKMEKLESFSKILFNMELLGKKKTITKEKLNQLYEIAETTYGIKITDGNRII